jgi:Family of unknown function (DUF5996)
MGSPTPTSLVEWPELPLAPWRDTYRTLHMWTQVVGKVRLALVPYINHYWNVTLFLTSEGLTTLTMPYRDRTVTMTFDFVDHQLEILTSAGEQRQVDLAPRTVADFYAEVLARLRELKIDVRIWPMPVEVENPVRFDRDHDNKSYDREYVERWWRVMLSSESVLKEFRGRFIGKSSPVHFFWGSFDLAVTRFSGRRAPERPDADKITREAYSHEVTSVGFWPGGGRGVEQASYYSYAAPEPAGFPKARVGPAGAAYSDTLSEFLIGYDDVRRASSPRDALMEFAQTTYEAGATLGGWDRAALEKR